MATIDFATREDLLRLEAKVDKLLKMVDRERETVCIKDISKKLGISDAFLRYSAPWLLPNHGASQYPGTKRWDREVYEQWSERPVKEREQEYKAQRLEIARQKLKKRG